MNRVPPCSHDRRRYRGRWSASLLMFIRPTAHPQRRTSDARSLRTTSRNAYGFTYSGGGVATGSSKRNSGASRRFAMAVAPDIRLGLTHGYLRRHPPRVPSLVSRRPGTASLTDHTRNDASLPPRRLIVHHPAPATGTRLPIPSRRPRAT